MIVVGAAPMGCPVLTSAPGVLTCYEPLVWIMGLAGAVLVWLRGATVDFVVSSWPPNKQAS
ncbi:hypothetical protein IF2G_04340 [Cordyceps javanica]|nr:hypothetical protein IF2G_04340 [Cordyceps javanica]